MNNKPSSKIKIGSKVISKSAPVYFIAEIGSNFDQDINRAKDLIHLAKEAGADAVKFQHYTASGLVSDHGFRHLGAQKSHQAKWSKSVYDTYEDASLRKEWTEDLKQACEEIGVEFFTSPYSLELVDYVDRFVPAFKIGSGDITWPDIIKSIASKGKPVLLATGASSLEDVKRAAEEVLSINPNLILMQCNTNYTADEGNLAHLQLNVLRTYERHFPNIILGLSDHTLGHVSVLGAVALGARVIEKHFTDSTDRDGPDHPFSMTPPAWREMVIRTRELESSLGNGEKKIEMNERETSVVQRRCIRARTALQSGNIIRKKDLIALRPCPEEGIPPYQIEKVIGSVLIKDLAPGENILWANLEKG